MSVVMVATAVLVAACTSSVDLADCRRVPRVDTGGETTANADAPFRLPLDLVINPAHDADFQENRGTPGSYQYHAAEDYHAPAGTPVYAMADGDVSFSGPMGGYGWLVIVDHPWANLYSLYGHLSPSRWSAQGGHVEKGDLLGYLGDEWENGGSKEQPLTAHLHLGVRAGQRTDYPGRGDWRWMAGWIKSCPGDIGWLQPSAVIAAQAIPEGGFAAPEGRFLERWGVELLVLLATVGGVVWWIGIGVRRENWIIPTAVGGFAAVGGFYFTHRGFVLAQYGMYTTAAVCLVAAVVIAARRRTTHA